MVSCAAGEQRSDHHPQVHPHRLLEDDHEGDSVDEAAQERAREHVVEETETEETEREEKDASLMTS